MFRVVMGAIEASEAEEAEMEGLVVAWHLMMHACPVHAACRAGTYRCDDGGVTHGHGAGPMQASVGSTLMRGPQRQGA